MPDTSPTPKCPTGSFGGLTSAFTFRNSGNQQYEWQPTIHALLLGVRRHTVGLVRAERHRRRRRRAQRRLRSVGRPAAGGAGAVAVDLRRQSCETTDIILLKPRITTF